MRRTIPAALVLVGTMVVGGASPGSAAPPAEPPTAATKQTSITLITGDVVRLADGLTGPVNVRRGPGREKISFTVSRVEGRLYVVPSDAFDLLRAGRLERGLFDVAALLEAGYGDAESDALQVIVERPTAELAAGRTTRTLVTVPAKAATFQKSQLGRAWKSIRAGAAKKIWLDGLSRPMLDRSVPQVGAPTAWQAGHAGAGTKVAVLDTGIDVSHADLAGRVLAAKNFTDDVPGDTVGHGTHVASTIAGRGEKYRGVAPDAQLLDGKVCTYGCRTSDILAGMEWAAVEQRADVVNLSLGGMDTTGVGLLEAAVNQLSAQTGALFVVSAGNRPFGCFRSRGGVSAPASADAALAVGAVDKADGVAAFSCPGPRVGDSALKPDVSAPGVEIVAAEAGTPDGHIANSGTSMAAPHVAGAAAILAGKHPDWGPDQLKAALMGSVDPRPSGSVFEQGTGRLDVGRAVTQSVVPSVGSLSFATQLFPHADDRPESKPLTYRNLGSTPVRLTFALELRGPDGSPAPAGAIRLSASSLVVPAGGTARVNITSATAHDGPDGLYAGRLVATGAGTSIVTAVGVEKELESYDLTIKHVDRQGRPIYPVETLVSVIDGDLWDTAYEPTSVIRLPKGRYALSSYLRFESSDLELEDRAFLAQPEIVVDKDVTVTVDGGAARAIDVTVPEDDAAPVSIVMGFASTDTLGFYYVTGGTFAGLSTAQLGPSVPDDEFASSLAVEFCRSPEGYVCDADSPYRYLLEWFELGSLFTGFDRDLEHRELAKVEAHDDGTGNRDGYLGEGETAFDAQPLRYGHQADLGGIGGFHELPRKVTEYYQPEGVRWYRQFREFDLVDDELVSRSEFGRSPRTFRAGESVRERWNTAPFGPGFPATDSRPFDPAPRPWASRSGDRVSVGLPLFTDANGLAGWFRTDSARTELFRNGERVAGSDQPGVLEADVPRGAATYRLTASADARSLGTFSTRVEAAWTFQSRHARKQTALPLAAVRFAPAVDDEGRAKPGRAVVPVSVQRHPGSAPWLVRQLAVDISYDDGRSWQRGALRRTGVSTWALTVRPPAGATYVSLRAKANGTGGNGVEQTIVRAYEIAES